MIDSKSRIIELPKITDPRGNLTFVESNNQIPFAIERVYYLYDVPENCERGGHAHRRLEQLIVAMSGSFDVILDDGKNQKRVHLNRPHSGLYVGPYIWRSLDNFSLDAACVVLASRPYEEEDYIRKYDEFLLTRLDK